MYQGTSTNVHHQLHDILHAMIIHDVSIDHLGLKFVEHSIVDRVLLYLIVVWFHIILTCV